ncbi:hypothetical protein Cpap_1537 [Ruminiclostridium papyrosolvens DSM 2782]|uniref:Kelch repeat type 1-containing protein n=1 Tax=Ruminiclostridium papyrosolvens DSM 2782 TaxID=588581 RepID=F1TEH9_9FIRM|nr:hypothetical protein [Ruminiclostridium papyrosolvens]EGD47145.1 hypothetical protein Cpap_1537 [Ruminiclostridium papyrosolvens DSM 2782]WES36087.1 hypothetical protein P0092_09025 [Ruminiclostridium papyrosolvens DSM 2782]WES36185.1 hypothetical protein P0092_09525 [Ruminiclostridium papyrosolvens DSM 2782]
MSGLTPLTEYPGGLNIYNDSAFSIETKIFATSNNSTWYQYDLNTNTWTLIPLSWNKSYIMAYDNDRIYIWGYDYNSYYYDINTGDVTPNSGLPLDHKASVIVNGIIYSFFYFNSNGIDRFCKLQNNSWVSLSKPDMGNTSNFRYLHVWNNYIYLFNINGTYRYDVLTNTWVTLTLPTGTYSQYYGNNEKPIEYNGKLYFLFYIFLFIFDLVTETWQQSIRPTLPRYYDTYGASYLSCVNGLFAINEQNSCLMQLNLQTNTWSFVDTTNIITELHNYSTTSLFAIKGKTILMYGSSGNPNIIFLRSSGVWKEPVPYLKTNTAWKNSITPNIRINGTWK